MSQKSSSTSSDPSGLGENQVRIPAPPQSSQPPAITAEDASTPDPSAGRGGGYNDHQASVNSTQTPTFAVRGTSSANVATEREEGLNLKSSISEVPSLAVRAPTEPVVRDTPALPEPAASTIPSTGHKTSPDNTHNETKPSSQSSVSTVRQETSPDPTGRGSGYNAAPDSSYPSQSPTFVIRDTPANTSGRGGYNDAPTPSALPTFARRDNIQPPTRDLSPNRTSVPSGANSSRPEHHVLDSDTVGGRGKGHNDHVRSTDSAGRGAWVHGTAPPPAFGGRGGGYNDAAGKSSPQFEDALPETNSEELDQRGLSHDYPHAHAEHTEHGDFAGRGDGYDAQPHAGSPGFGGRGGYNDNIREGPKVSLQPENREHDHNHHHNESSHDYPRAHEEHGQNGGFGGRGSGYNSTPRDQSPGFGGRGGYNDDVRGFPPKSPSIEQREPGYPPHQETQDYPRAHTEHSENGGFGGRGGYNTTPHDQSPGFGGRGGYNATPRDPSPGFGGRGGYNEDLRRLSPRPSPSIEQHEPEYHHDHNSHDYPRAHGEHGENGGFGGRGGYNATPQDQFPGFGGRGGYNASPRDRSPGFGGRGGYNDDIRRLSPKPSPSVEKSEHESHHHDHHHHNESHDYPRAYAHQGHTPHGSRNPSPSPSGSRSPRGRTSPPSRTSPPLGGLERSRSPHNKHGSSSGSGEGSPNGNGRERPHHRHAESQTGNEYPHSHSEFGHHGGFGGRGGYNAMPGAS